MRVGVERGHWYSRKHSTGSCIAQFLPEEISKTVDTTGEKSSSSFFLLGS